MNLRKTLTGLAMGAVLLAALPSLANDTSAELAAGGLILTQDADIEMRSEDLFVSRGEVSVRYVFFNTARRDKTIRVAFPMPDMEFSESPMAQLSEDPVNLLNFRTRIDGAPVSAEVEQKALKDGVDISARLRALGIPLAPHLNATWEAMDALPQAAREALVRDDIAFIQEYDQGDGRGMQQHLYPRWKLTTIFHWEQVFPAGREMVVEHTYQPAAGASAGTGVGSPYADQNEPYYSQFLQRYCVDDHFLAGVRKRMREQKAEYPPFWETRIAYVLKTGANWAKPIGRFRMVIDKGAPENLVSFCASGVRKISDTRFEVVRENYIPDRDLDVLILSPTPTE